MRCYFFESFACYQSVNAIKVTHSMPPTTTLFNPRPPKKLRVGMLDHGHLKHGISEECLKRAFLTVRLGFILFQQLVEVAVLLAVGQDLQAVLVITHKLLVDVQHGQQDVK